MKEGTGVLLLGIRIQIINKNYMPQTPSPEFPIPGLQVMKQGHVILRITVPDSKKDFFFKFFECI